MQKKTPLKFKNTKILIVDDCEFNRELLFEILYLMEIETDSAEDGIEAIKKVRNGHYDLVLMDIQMPNKDGISATQELKQGPTLPPPIIAVTASALEEERQRCLKAGMDDYITKPITISALEQLFHKYLKNKIVAESQV